MGRLAAVLPLTIAQMPLLRVILPATPPYAQPHHLFLYLRDAERIDDVMMLTRRSARL